MSNPSAELTQLLVQSAQGDEDATRRAYLLVLDTIGDILARWRRDPDVETIHTTGLVHEAYLRLGQNELTESARLHFFLCAAGAMRDLLVAEARERTGGRYRPGMDLVTFDEVYLNVDAAPEKLLGLHEILRRLQPENPQEHKLVLLRYFAGLGFDEIGLLLGTSHRTLQRRWSFCRAWLAQELESAR